MILSSRSVLLLSVFSFLLAFCVIVLGAYVRLSDAGLGCPDWPGCYGQLFVTDDMAHETLTGSYDDARPFNKGKALKEMAHRYAAGLLGLAIGCLMLFLWRAKHRQRHTGYILFALVLLQAMLGMWTVTALLKPAIVVAHLLGGMLILAMLYWLILRQLSFVSPEPDKTRPISKWCLLALAVLTIQIFLGGWTSANYAALVCPEFPSCRGGMWLPQTDFKGAFHLFDDGGGRDYEGGVLDAEARTAIHITHRVGALVTFIVILGAILSAVKVSDGRLRALAATVFIVLCAQISLGVANIMLVLPLPVAVAHNGVAALLMLSLITLYLYCKGAPQQ